MAPVVGPPRWLTILVATLFIGVIVWLIWLITFVAVEVLT